MSKVLRESLHTLAWLVRGQNAVPKRPKNEIEGVAAGKPQNPANRRKSKSHANHV